MVGKGQAGRILDEEFEAPYYDVLTFFVGIRPKRALRITLPPAPPLHTSPGTFFPGILCRNTAAIAAFPRKTNKLY
jgi:hypothetical protein